MTEDWKRLGVFIRNRRKALVMNQVQLGQAAGLGRSTVQKLEWGTARPERKTLRLIEDALRWLPGSAAAILAGGQPSLAEDLSPEESYRREPMSDDDMVVVIHHVVYDLAAHTNPGMTLTELRELEDRAMRVVRSLGINGPGRRASKNVTDDPEP